MVLNQAKKDIHAGQALYLGRWVDKSKFRVFVYDKKGHEKLANTWKEFEDLIASGLWYAVKPKEPISDKKERRNDAALSNGK